MKALRLIPVIALLILIVSVTGAQDMMYNEAPMLADMVAAGDLPPVEERLPSEPLVVEPAASIGQYGGTWRMGMRGGNDNALLVRTMGYEGLLRWDPQFQGIVNNVAKDWEANEDGSVYTFHLREGMKWSDGEAYTAHDIVFWYESAVVNDEVRPGKPAWMVVNGELGVVEAVDDYTVQFSFAGPNGLFTQFVAAVDGREITRYPRHWAAEFHADFNPDGIDALVEEAGLETWVDLWDNKIQQGDGFREVKPVIGAWIHENGTNSDITQLTAVRNPYYWKVDPEGNQYPYIDFLQYDVGEDTETLVLKALNGEIDMQDRHIATLNNKAVFFDNMEAGGYTFFDKIPSGMNTMIIAFNLTTEDPVLSEVFNNRDFRVALSHAINRQEIIDVVFVGQGEPYQAAPRPSSPFYNETLAKQYTEYDPDTANQILDEAGFAERDGDGFRLGPDGNRISFAVEVHTVAADRIDMLELVQGYWADVGIDMQVEVEDRSILYDRKEANEHQAVVWGGDGGLEIFLEPRWYFPFSNESNFAMLWNFWFNGDARGVEPPDAPKRQMDLYRQIQSTADGDLQVELMTEILNIAQEEFYTIGISLPAPGYGIRNANMQNVPDVFPSGWKYPHPAPLNVFTFYYQ